MSYGDLGLMVELYSQSSPDFAPQVTTAKILDEEIALRDVNVMLIDGADSGHPSIVATRWVDPHFSDKDPVAAVVKRAPELFDFLRCDLPIPSEQMHPFVDGICSQMRP
jgi:hypothetical protein